MRENEDEKKTKKWPKKGKFCVCNAMSHDDDADAMGKYVGIVM